MNCYVRFLSKKKKKTNEHHAIVVVTFYLQLTNTILYPNQGATMMFNCSRYISAFEKYVHLNEFYTNQLPGVVTKGWQCLMDSSSKALPALSTVDG